MAHDRLDCDIVPIGDLPLYNQESDGDPPEQYRRFRDEIAAVDGVLLDLGLSSMQVDRHERGFSYATDAPLDMRMDPSDEPSAAEIVNTRDERELATIFRRYGEERYARQIARAIARRRQQEPIERTGQLVDVVKASIAGSIWSSATHIGSAMPVQGGLISARAGECAMKIRARLNKSVEFL